MSSGSEHEGPLLADPRAGPEGADRFAGLAHRLAARDRDLGAGLARARRVLEGLREQALERLERFTRAAREAGAPHLCDLRVGEVEPDEKHVDCLQLRVARGRFELCLVAKARGVVTVVGPFRRGKTEKPCRDCELPESGESPELVELLDARLLALLEEASAR